MLLPLCLKLHNRTARRIKEFQGIYIERELDWTFTLYCFVLNINVCSSELIHRQTYTKKHINCTFIVHFTCCKRQNGFIVCFAYFMVFAFSFSLFARWYSLIFAHVSNMNAAKFAFNEKNNTFVCMAARYTGQMYRKFFNYFSKTVVSRVSRCEAKQAHCHYCSHCLSLSMPFSKVYKWNKIVQRYKKNRNKFCFIEVDACSYDDSQLQIVSETGKKRIWLLL